MSDSNSDRENSEGVRLIVVSLGKSGTQWLWKLLGQLPSFSLFDMAAHKCTATTIEETNLVGEGEVIYSHMRHSENLVKHLNERNFRIFYIFRDLRDALVSEYHHKKYLNPKVMVPLHPILSQIDDEHAFEIENILQWTSVANGYRDVQNWLEEPSAFAMSYEELLKDSASVLERALRFHKIDVDRPSIESAVDACSFKTTSGRVPGKEDKKSHLRKGIVGDWRNHFTPSQKEDFKEAFNDMLVEYGYESDGDW